MKRKWYFCLWILLAALLSFPAGATDVGLLRQETVQNEPGADELFALRNETADWINSILATENTEQRYSNGKRHEAIAKEDVAFDNMYKIYTISPDDWARQTTGRAAFRRNGPNDRRAGNRIFSDENIQSIQDGAGHWSLGSAGLTTADRSYGVLARRLADVLDGAEETVCFANIPYLWTFGAVSPSDKETRFRLWDRQAGDTADTAVFQTYGQKQFYSILSEAQEAARAFPSFDENGNTLYGEMGIPWPLPLPKQESAWPVYAGAGIAALLVFGLAGLALTKKRAGVKK